MTSVVWVLTSGSYEVSSIDHLMCIATQGSGFTTSGSVPSYMSATYKQTANINCTGKTMIPIGTMTPTVVQFTGIYDGQNYEIQNWQNDQASNSNSQGIFGYLSGTLKNISVTGLCKVRGNALCAILVGFGGTTYNINNISMNLSSGSIVSTISGSCAGLIGDMYRGTQYIEHIQITGYLTISCGTQFAGGVIGWLPANIYLSDIIISTIGNITGTYAVGGIVGFSGGPYRCAGLINAIQGNITSTTSGTYGTGGIIGYLSSATVFEITCCINKMKGNITGPDYVGGIVGNTPGSINNCINIMEGNIVSTSTTTYSGGIGYTSQNPPTIQYNILAMKGNAPNILSGTISSYTNVLNNIYSNRNSMTINGSVITTSNSVYWYYDTLSSFPSQLSGSTYTTSWDSSINIPKWTYSYTDALGNNRTISSSDSVTYTATPTISKLYSFNFAFNETKTTYANIGIGTTSPSKTLDVAGDINFTGNLYLNNTLLGTSWYKQNTTDIKYNDNGNIGIGQNTGQYKLDVYGTIRANSYLTVSDIRLKENIEDEYLGLEFIKLLNPKTFNYINDTMSKTRHGFIAQDISENDLVFIDNNGIMSININSLIAPITKSIQELSIEYNNLKNELLLLQNKQ